MSWTEGCVTERKTPNHELLKSGRIRCTGCGKWVEKAHFVDPCWRFCTVACFIQSRPMVLTGDTSRIDAIATETKLNTRAGRGKRKSAV